MRESKDSPLRVRPHHGLCGEFFRGMGYSEEFAENMKNVLERLNAENPYIVPTVGADIICGKCPNNPNDVCVSAEKVRRYDLAVLERCGLSEGKTVSWNDFKALVREKIIEAGKLSEVCGDCEWFGFCGKQ